MERHEQMVFVPQTVNHVRENRGKNFCNKASYMLTATAHTAAAGHTC